MACTQRNRTRDCDLEPVCIRGSTAVRPYDDVPFVKRLFLVGSAQAESVFELGEELFFRGAYALGAEAEEAAALGRGRGGPRRVVNPLPVLDPFAAGVAVAEQERGSLTQR